MENDLQKRLFDFAVAVFQLLRKIPYDKDLQIYKTQLIKSSSSSGANYEEAQAGSSKADFINKVNISLKEMRESNYFLRLIQKTAGIPSLETEITGLIEESKQLKNILGSIASKTRSNLKSKLLLLFTFAFLLFP